MNKLAKDINNIPTLGKAVIAFCKECLYDDRGIGNGSWRQQITDCTAPDCPLYNVRPLTSEANNKIKQAKYDLLSEEDKIKYDIKSKIASDRMKSSLVEMSK